MYLAGEHKSRERGAFPGRVVRRLDRGPPRQMAFRRFRPEVSIVKESKAYNNHIRRTGRAGSKTTGVYSRYVTPIYASKSKQTVCLCARNEDTQECSHFATPHLHVTTPLSQTFLTFQCFRACHRTSVDGRRRQSVREA